MTIRELSIIQYQNVSSDPHVSRLWLSTDAFRRQMEYLSANEFSILSMDDALHYMTAKRNESNGRPISLTFDNGFLDFYEHALPILAGHQFPATVLICPKRVGASADSGTTPVRYLSWERLEELSKLGITIGAYEDDAWNINSIPDDTTQRHIVEYKKTLEDKLGIEICYFGVKEGVPNQRIRDLIIQEGYKAFLTECPTNRGPDLYSLGRIQVDDDDFNIFLTKISRTYLYFKDKRSWKYIREYNLDKLAHWLSERYDKLRGMQTH